MLITHAQCCHKYERSIRIFLNRINTQALTVYFRIYLTCLFYFSLFYIYNHARAYYCHGMNSAINSQRQISSQHPDPLTRDINAIRSRRTSARFSGSKNLFITVLRMISCELPQTFLVTHIDYFEFSQISVVLFRLELDEVIGPTVFLHAFLQFGKSKNI